MTPYSHHYNFGVMLVHTEQGLLLCPFSSSHHLDARKFKKKIVRLVLEIIGSAVICMQSRAARRGNTFCRMDLVICFTQCPLSHTQIVAYHPCCVA
jgi:hypothetical protein